MLKITAVSQIKVADIVRYHYGQNWWLYEITNITPQGPRGHCIEKHENFYSHVTIGMYQTISALWFSPPREVYALNRDV